VPGSVPARALGGNAHEQRRGRLVVRVLRHEVAGEGVAEDGLSERSRGPALRVEIGSEVIDEGELAWETPERGHPAR